jgi:RNA polymerase sigma-B factor
MVSVPVTSEWVEDVIEQHHRYAADRDGRLRAELVEHYVPMCRRLARRFTGRGESFEDLVQVALVGLLEALERFDPGRGIPFPAFAAPTILGELKRHFRDHRWKVRVPRRIQNRFLEVQRARDDLAQTLGRIPSVADIADHLGISTDDVVEAMDAGATFEMPTLDGESGGNGASADVPVTEPGYQRIEDRVFLGALVSRLPRQRQLVLQMRFGQGMSQAAIGRRLGTSQMHISRSLAGSLATLRALSGTHSLGSS